MWLYRTGGLSSAGTEERSNVLYEYQPGRGAKHPASFLEDFRGYLHTGGYAAYYKLPEQITVVGCWAHARRKFDEALKSIATGHASAKNIHKGLDFCNRLFTIEQKLADLPAEERYKQHLEQARPVLDELFCIRPSPGRTGRWLHSAIASNGSR